MSLGCQLTTNTSLGEADFLDLTVEAGTLNGVVETVNDENFFDLILLDGNTLYFGLPTDELDGFTAETRPTELDLSLPFTRL